MNNDYGNMKEAIAGLTYGLDSDTESLAAGERIYPGDPVFGMVGDEKMCYTASINAVSLTANGNLVAGNIITVTINGIKLNPITFEGTSVDTIKQITNAIDASPEIRALGIDAFFLASAPRAIHLQGAGVSITASATVTGGTARTFTQADYTSKVFMGVARFQQLAYGKETGFYPSGSSVSVQTRGKVFVPLASNADPADKKPAYVVLTGNNAGKFTDVATSNYDSGCFFRSSRCEGDLALVELRGMK